MYIPKAFEIDDPTVTLAFMRAHNFATLVSHGPNGLEASHLPFIVRRSDEGATTLHAHLARANPQWQHFDGSTEALVIFQGPHAYVSPTLYETHPSVPTWNYQVVHASGTPSIVDDPEGMRAHVLALIAQHEEGSQTPWSPELPENYLQSMLRQIVAIRIEVTKVETKFKLGQNRSRVDRESMAGWFASSDDPMLQALGNATLATLGVESIRATLPPSPNPD